VGYYIQRTKGIMLSDIDIKKALEEKWIEVSPLDKDFIQPSSIDLKVGYEFRVFENHKYSHIDPKAEQEDLTTLVTATVEEPFVLHPGEFVLGTTFEKVTLSNKVVARLEGKSSLGRIGLLIHSTAGFVDPGFSGYLTLELSNVANLPIMIYPEMKIGQISFYYLNSPSESEYGSENYGSKYQGQEGPTPSRSHSDFNK
jgi:dCTP deaminase|tara:strand:- start:8622 stop:9218 length:597 start_codon:yes stop_codon:yes gene_type:complete